MLDASILPLDVATRRLDATERRHRLDAHRSLDVKPRRHGSTQARRRLDAGSTPRRKARFLDARAQLTLNPVSHILTCAGCTGMKKKSPKCISLHYHSLQTCLMPVDGVPRHTKLISTCSSHHLTWVWVRRTQTDPYRAPGDPHFRSIFH